MLNNIPILPMPKRVLILVPMNKKFEFQLTPEIKIEWHRWVENFDGREANPTNGIVVAGEGLESGVEVLIEHNATHASNEIYDHDEKLEKDYKLFSVAETEVLLWRKKYDESDELKGWQLYRNVSIVARIFEQQKSIIWLKPKIIEDKQFVLKGNYLHKAIVTAKAAAYTIIYQEVNGRDAQITVMKDLEDYDIPIVLGVDEPLTERVLSGDVVIGNDKEGADTKVYSVKNNLEVV